MAIFNKFGSVDDAQKGQKPKKETKKELRARIAAEEAAERMRVKAETRAKEQERLSALSEKELLIELLLKLSDYEDYFEMLQNKLDHISRDVDVTSTQTTLANLNASVTNLKK